LNINKAYIAPTAVLFVTELIIGLFVHDNFIRPYLGDLLVVLLLYCAARIFISASTIATATAVLIFAYAIEISQYFHLIYRLGWQKSLLARIVLGTSFSITDMGMYSLSFVIIIIAERTRSKKPAFKL
jgi:hypothetical protein